MVKNVFEMNSNGCSFMQESEGCAPLRRPIRDYISFGVINLDKPSNPSSHEVVAWVKRILDVEKTGHSGTLDPKVSGCLIVCIEKATRLVKSQQQAGKGYVAILRLDEPSPLERLVKACAEFVGPIYQRPPAIAAVKRNLRIRTVYSINVLEYDEKEALAILKVDCEAGTYIRVLCFHIGVELGGIGYMEELRRVKSGVFTERENMVTMHDILDANWLYERRRDERYLRKVILPLENLLVNHKRIIVKDSAVAALCFGAALCKSGIIYFDNGINEGDEIVLVSSKGEAIALAYATCSTDGIALSTYGFCAKLKRVIMEREHYRRQWVETRKRRLEKTSESAANPAQGGAGAPQPSTLNVIHEGRQAGQATPARSDTSLPRKRPRHSRD
ncbi:hypothetical protein Aperf_G00000006185 [Anoplocephala perfoliata]